MSHIHSSSSAASNGMQAVILAAGRGTRMTELTASVPKPMLLVAGRPLLEYKIDALPDSIDEVVLVVGYLQHVIREHFGASYGGRRIVYVEQKKELDGTAGALWSARSVLHDRFLVMMGDDLYGKDDIKRACEADRSGVGTCRRSGTWMMFAMHLDQLQGGGRIIVDRGQVTDIIENDEHRTGGLVSTNLFSLDVRLFGHEMVPKRAGSQEYGLPQTILAASRASGIPLELVQTDAWIQITSPEDLQYAERILMKAV